jgi:hypothetical protein
MAKLWSRILRRLRRRARVGVLRIFSWRSRPTPSEKGGRMATPTRESNRGPVISERGVPQHDSNRRPSGIAPEHAEPSRVDTPESGPDSAQRSAFGSAVADTSETIDGLSHTAWLPKDRSEGGRHSDLSEDIPAPAAEGADAAHSAVGAHVSPESTSALGLGDPAQTDVATHDVPDDLEAERASQPRSITERLDEGNDELRDRIRPKGGTPIEWIGLLDLTEEQAHDLGSALAVYMKSHAGDDAVDQVWKRFPDACACYVVFEGAFSYCGNNLWSAVSETLGIDEAAANAWGEQFIKYLERHGLSNPPMDGMSRVTPILLHGLMPNASLTDFFELIEVVTADLALTTIAANEVLAAVCGHPDRHSFPEPVKRFVQHGGDAAVRAVGLALRWMSRAEALKPASTRAESIPQRFLDAFRAWRKGTGFGPSAEGISRLARPHLYFGRSSVGLQVRFPAQHVDPGPSAFQWVLRAGPKSWAFTPPHTKTHGTIDPLIVELPVRAEQYEVEMRRDGDRVRGWMLAGIPESGRWLAFDAERGDRLEAEAIPASRFLLVFSGDRACIRPPEAIKLDIGSLDAPMKGWTAVEVDSSDRLSIEVGTEVISIGKEPFGIRFEAPEPFGCEATFDAYCPLFVGVTPKLRVEGADRLSNDARIQIRSLGLTHPRNVTRLRCLREIAVATHDGVIDLGHPLLRLGRDARGRFRVDVRDGEAGSASVELRIAPYFRLRGRARGYEVETRNNVRVNDCDGNAIVGRDGWWSFFVPCEPTAPPVVRFREETPSGIVSADVCLEQLGLHVSLDASAWDRIAGDETSLPLLVPSNRLKAARSWLRIEGEFGTARGIELQLVNEDGATCVHLENPRRIDAGRKRAVAIFDLTAFASSMESAAPRGLLRATWEVDGKHSVHDIVRLGPAVPVRAGKSVRLNASQTQVDVTWECDRGVTECRTQVVREEVPSQVIHEDIWHAADATGHFEATIDIAFLGPGRYLVRIVPFDPWVDSTDVCAAPVLGDPDVFTFEIDATARGDAEAPSDDSPLTSTIREETALDAAHHGRGNEPAPRRFAGQRVLDALDHALDQWSVFDDAHHGGRIDADRVELAEMGLFSHIGPRAFDEYRKERSPETRDRLKECWPGLSAMVEIPGMASRDKSAWRRYKEIVEPFRPSTHLPIPIGLHAKERDESRRTWKILDVALAESGDGLELIVESLSRREFHFRYVSVDGTAVDGRPSLVFSEALPHDFYEGRPPHPGDLAPTRRLAFSKSWASHQERVYHEQLSAWFARTAISTAAERELELAVNRLKAYLTSMRADRSAFSASLLQRLNDRLEIPDSVAGHGVETTIEGRTVDAATPGRRIPHACALVALASRVRARQRERGEKVEGTAMPVGDLARLAGLAMIVAPELFGWYLARIETLLVFRDLHRPVR